MSLIESVRRVRVSVDSPRGAVTAELAAAKGIRVRVDQRIAAQLTERALAEEVTIALMSVLRTYKTTVHSLRQAGDTSPKPGRSRRHKVFRDKALKIEFVTTSPRNWVKTRWHGHNDVEVRIRPGTLNGTEERVVQLTRDLNSAITESLTTRNREILAVHATTFDRAERKYQ